MSTDTATLTPDARLETSALPGAFDLMLRGQHALDHALEDESSHLPIIRRLIGLSTIGLAAHGAIVGLSIHLLGASGPWSELFRGPVVAYLPVSFVAAFLGALAICLPSFYFYTQIAGLDASFRLVTAQAARAQATTSVFLFGSLPIYLALALTSVVTKAIDPSIVIAVGLAMPFLVGLTGVRALFRGFRHMLDYVDITHARRGRVLLRLIGLWSIVYSTIAPVALYRAIELASAIS
jgi:hypothetical protein